MRANCLSVSGDVELAYDIHGSGRPLVFVHAFGASGQILDERVASLVAAGHQVYLFDQRGHGDSTNTGRARDYTLDQLGSDLVAFLNGVVGEPADLLAHSMGGCATTRAALEAPGLVRSIAFVDAVILPNIVEDADLRNRLIETFARITRGEADVNAWRIETAEEGELLRHATSPQWQADRTSETDKLDPIAIGTLGVELFSGLGDDLTSRLSNVACPATYIIGGNDVHFLAHADAARNAIDGCELVTIDGAYHCPLNTHGDIWLSAIADHFQRAA